MLYFFTLFLTGYVVACGIPRFTALYASSPDRSEPSMAFKHLFPVAVGIALAFLCWWETQWQAVSLGKTLEPLILNPESAQTLQLRFAVHAVFFLFLLAATYIDFEEMIIPDTITIPGTILGLLFATFLPQTLLPATQMLPQSVFPQILYGENSVPLHIASSQAWPESFSPAPATLSLFVLLGIWWFWCFATMNRVWYGRLPFRKAVAIFWRYLKRSRTTPLLLALGVLGSVGIAWMWKTAVPDSLHWRGLVSSLVGLFAGAILIWSVRIIGRFALGREAMGFGDVTLMAMIGAFVGWQPCVLIFFLAPLAGVFLGIGRVLLGLGRELPYGPFLCLGTVVLILFWPQCWNFGEPFFSWTAFVPTVMFLCLVLLGAMLWGWNRIKSKIINKK
ncbi:MAG: A24 family peptidase [Planctomycetaceae bacterium]|nr:A24 family peptidase [Planctomycetaceae bacterium]